MDQPHRWWSAQGSAADTWSQNARLRSCRENVLAEMLEKVLAYNISQIIRVRKKLSEPEERERAAA